MAEPREILVSDATRIMIAGTPEFTFREPVSATFKGLGGPYLLHRVAW